MIYLIGNYRDFYMMLVCLPFFYYKMDNEGKNGRRKRKDPESRDFLCKCGKSYLSYAAAYTHVKNKHNLERDFVDNIKKPQREQLRRGRPKQKKQSSYTIQTALLTLIQSAILRVNSEIQGSFAKTILQGNEQREQQQFAYHYESLLRAKEDILGNSNIAVDPLLLKFSEMINKDFTSEVAAKIRLSAELIAFAEELDQEQFMEKMRRIDIWGGKQSVNKILLDTYKEWKKLYTGSAQFQPSQKELNEQENASQS